MRGDLVFETLGGVDARFILEAAPDSTSAPIGVSSDETLAKPPKDRRPLGGWVAAAVCAVVALGVYLGAMWLGQSEWQSPAVTGEGTNDTDMTDPEVTLDETADETADETTPPDDGLVEPSPTFANKHYVVKEIDGQYYLNFYNRKRIYGDDIAVPEIEFSNMEEMFSTLYYGNLTDRQVGYMKNYYVTSQGYPFFDLCNLAVPVSEEGHEIGRISFFGNTYSVNFYIPGLAKRGTMVFKNHNRRSGWASEAVVKADTDADTRTEGVFANMPAVIATNNYKNIKWQTIYVFHFDATTDTEFYATIRYEFPPDTVIDENFVYDMPPSEINIIATKGNMEYSVYIINGIPEDFVFTRDFLLSFKIEPFDTPRVEPMAVMNKEPYEVVEEDGAWYLTFPEWDGTIPDEFRPAEGTAVSLPSFSDVSQLRKILSGEGMSLYCQLLMMLNADEQNRIRVPQYDLLLSPSLPERYSKPLTFYLDGTGRYYGSVRDYDCTMVYDVHFEVTDEESWLAEREKSFLKEGEHGLTILQVAEGTFDGLPCTFYEYNHDPSSKEGEYVLCHIRLTEDTHAREYFFLVYGDLYDLNIDQDETNVYPEHLDYPYGRDATIFGVINGQYYYFRVAEIQKLTADIFRQFTVTPVTP